MPRRRPSATMNTSATKATASRSMTVKVAAPFDRHVVEDVAVAVEDVLHQDDLRPDEGSEPQDGVSRARSLVGTGQTVHVGLLGGLLGSDRCGVSPGGRWRSGAEQQLHAGLGRRAVGLAVVAAQARCHRVLPREPSAAASWHHVVDRLGRAAAVGAHAVAGLDRRLRAQVAPTVTPLRDDVAHQTQHLRHGKRTEVSPASSSTTATSRTSILMAWRSETRCRGS